MRRLGLALAVLGFLLSVGTSTRADEVTSFYLTLPDQTSTPIGNVPADSALVTVDLATSGKSATITFTGENGYNVSEAFLNVNGAYTYGSNTCNGTCINYNQAESLDGYGAFDGEVQSPEPSSTISVVVNLTSGTWANALSVLTLTTNGVTGDDEDAAATLTKSSTGGIYAGGYNEDLGGSYAPEPSSMLLFGSGLLALGAIFRKKLAVS